MNAPTNPSASEAPAAQQIDAIIQEFNDWRGQTMSRLRSAITQADPDVVEEVKWKKPSRPLGVPVFSHTGNLCICEALKSAVRLTFPKGALLDDATHLFNARLDSKSVRAIDVHENAAVDEAALTALIREAVELNTRDRAGR